jgi:hypothetical protein
MKIKPSKTPHSSDGAGLEPDNPTLLGQVLVELGYVTVYQLDQALEIQRTASKTAEREPLGQVLLELGYCNPNQLIRAIQVQTEYRKAKI